MLPSLFTQSWEAAHPSVTPCGDATRFSRCIHADVDLQTWVSRGQEGQQIQARGLDDRGITVLVS